MYTPYINRLTAILRAFGWQVRIDTNIPAAGRCYYGSRTILLNTPNAQDALMTLAHEAGHAIHYHRRRDLNRSEGGRARAAREVQAYLIGWAVLRHLDAPVSKSEWRDYHPDQAAARCSTGGLKVDGGTPKSRRKRTGSS